ncbi:MAG: aminodeoxychorismate/anthranilate synthase component II [Flavobacteriales bacterium]|nr:aminodeoxychorismate/anthranilate synthase component II [Flavobacteriales bacterium]MCB9449053.1 aminodeoxychorismate/anthranilate synthase component II [Flavobacteriales bacterium]
MRILIFDNYDSFTYNLVHIVQKLGYDNYEVFRNDKIALEDIAAYDKIILSPGPGIPSEAGILLDLIRTYAPSKSILGVCLGHQAIGEVFGAQLVNIPDVMHGVATSANVLDEEEILFRDVPHPLTIGRYHSWIVGKEGFPNDVLRITAEDEQGHIMGLRHLQYDVRGVQFHPESVLTEHGEQMLQNWLTH